MSDKSDCKNHIKERQDLEELCGILSSLNRILRQMEYRKTIFVIEDRLSQTTNEQALTEYIDEHLDPIHDEALHRISELNA